MAGKLVYERYRWFHDHVKGGTHPNATSLAQKFEISIKQAQRDIEFMRDRLGAPLHFSYVKRGYVYEDTGYELPPVWIREDELFALSLALRLAAAVPDRKLKNSLHHLIDAVVASRTAVSPGIKEIEEKVSVKNIEYYRVQEPVFHSVLGALFQNKPLRITYRTPYTGEVTERLVQPLHLMCYMGTWHLIAFCTLRGELRDFALSRFLSIYTADGSIDLPPSLPSVKEYLRLNFGVISGRESIRVVLKFKSGAARWISEQIWHDNQELQSADDGCVYLTFPVAGFDEVAKEVLKYGADVEVIEPDTLKVIVREEIKKMNNLYR